LGAIISLIIQSIGRLRPEPACLCSLLFPQSARISPLIL
jgi:hypothetical protein